MSTQYYKAIDYHMRYTVSDKESNIMRNDVENVETLKCFLPTNLKRYKDLIEILESISL